MHKYAFNFFDLIPDVQLLKLQVLVQVLVVLLLVTAGVQAKLVVLVLPDLPVPSLVVLVQDRHQPLLLLQ